jgi:hypothetical protein
VVEHTALRTLALVPELRLHISTSILALWGAKEATLAPGRILDPPYWCARARTPSRISLSLWRLILALSVSARAQGGGVAGRAGCCALRA